MAAEEDLDLNGSAPPPKAKPGAAPAQPAEENVNKIETAMADLRFLTAPGQSNEDFVNRYLTAPEEKTIPWEECWLPSKGLYYGWPDGLVKVRPMGQTADKVLATERLAKTGQSMDYLFRECVQFPDGFRPEELLLGDRTFLLYFLRGITHGNIYEFAFTCPNQTCGAVSTHRYDLVELAQTITWADQNLGSEPFRVDLPYLSEASGRDVWVGVRFLRSADASDMLAKRRARQKLLDARPGGVKTRQPRGGISQQAPRRATNEELDDTISANLEKIIVSVMGVSDLFTIRAFIAKMHAQDTAAVREWLRDNTPGIDNTVTITCPECGTESTVELPITDSFFRPAKRVGA